MGRRIAEVSFVVLTAAILVASNVSAQTVDNSTVQTETSSLSLPAGSSTYLFGYATGGGFASSDLTTGQNTSVTDPDGFESAALAVTSSNSDSFSTSTVYQVMAGVGVSNYSSLTATYGSNSGPGQPPSATTGWTLSASANLTVSIPGSLVVLIGLGSSQQAISISGVPGLMVDGSSTVAAVEIAHAYPSVGSYTVTVNTVASAALQDPDHAADLVGAFVFTPGSPPGIGPTPTPTPTPTPRPTPMPTPTSAPAQTPQITSVQFSGGPGNYTLTITGSGFGGPIISPLPFRGDASNFRIGDEAQIGHGEWGYSGDADALTYQAWSDSSITVSGFGAQPGDAISIALWNSSSGIATTWGGNVPGISTPQITSVQLAGTGQNLQITVSGSGFGPAPVSMPFSGDLNYFDFGDFRAHCGAGSALFAAGSARWGVQRPDAVTLNYQSWSNTQIVISGFGGGYGSGCATYQAGDPLAITVWSTSNLSFTGAQTAWGGSGAPTTTSAPTGTPAPAPSATPVFTPPLTAAPTQTPTSAPTSTGFACAPAPAAAMATTWEAAKAASGKPPTIKAISFGKQALGTTSASVTATLKNTTARPMTITGITLKGNSDDFGGNDGCIAQTLPPNASCYVSVVFKPSKAGARSATLSITTSSPKLTAKLSGIGESPKVASLSSRSQAAFSQVTLNGSGFAPDAPVLVTFTEKLKGQPVLSIPEAAAQNNGASIVLTVPPVIDQATGGLVSGSATLSVQEALASGLTTLSAKSPSLKITVPPANPSLSPEQATLAFLQGEQGFAIQLQTDIVGTPLGTSALSSSLGQLVGSLNSLIAAIGSAATTTLGSVGGVNVTVDQSTLTSAETQLLAMLTTLAGGGGSQSAPASRLGGPTIRSQASGGGCLAAEAAQALNDTGNPAAFTSDIAQLFLASESSPACQQPGAAAAAAGIVNGAVGVALGVISQAGNQQVAMLAPAEALVYANLGPGSQLISTGVSLAQTSDPARQAVESSAQAFNLGASNQVSTAVMQSLGLLQNTYASTSQTATSFDEAAPPFDGTYSGNFTGTQFFTGGSSCSISGALAMGVAGSIITVSAPAVGGGALTNDSGSFTIGGLGGTGGSCSFTGIFSVNPAGAATASGTWLCIAPPSSSGFTSANGTWSASKQ